MALATRQPPVQRIVLDLSIEEAQVITALLGGTQAPGWHPTDKTVQSLYSVLSNALETEGFANWLKYRAKGTLELEERKDRPAGRGL